MLPHYLVKYALPIYHTSAYHSVIFVYLFVCPLCAGIVLIQLNRSSNNQHCVVLVILGRL